MAKGQIKQKQDNINQDQFESLCAIQCTEEEICAIFKCNTDTLCSWCKATYGKNFSEIFKEKRQFGKTSLRRMQWKTAEKGNVTMQIWLGKQLLDQREPEQEIEHNIGKVDNSFIEALNGKAKEVWEDDTQES